MMQQKQMKIQEAEITRQVQTIKSLNDEISKVKEQRQRDAISIQHIQLQIQSHQMKVLQQNMIRLQNQRGLIM